MKEIINGPIKRPIGFLSGHVYITNQLVIPVSIIEVAIVNFIASLQGALLLGITQSFLFSVRICTFILYKKSVVHNPKSKIIAK